jgi:hypothetical protein
MNEPYFTSQKIDCQASGAAHRARQTPTGEKDRDTDGEQTRVGPHRTCGEHIDEQNPHADDLSESPKVVDRLCHESTQILSKFFSISRRVSRSITGRPCGQTLEYAVARSSSRICVIFS